MLQEKDTSVTVELVQAVALVILILLMAAAVTIAAWLGLALARSRIAFHKLEQWYRGVGSRRTLAGLQEADAAHRARSAVATAETIAATPETVKERAPVEPPPLPTLKSITAPRLRLRGVSLVKQTSNDWSDDNRKTVQFHVVPPAPGEEVEPHELFEDIDDNDE